MPKVTKHTAPFDLYDRGLRVDKGDGKKPRLNRSKPADEKDTVWCPKGETYYTWEFRFGGSHRSRTYPKQSQLTQSNYLSQAYSLQEEVEDEVCPDNCEELQSLIDEWVGTLEGIRDECQDSFDNMPEGLQQGDTGQLLEARVNACDEAISNLQGVDTSYDGEGEDSEEGSEEMQEYEEGLKEFLDEAFEEARTCISDMEVE